MAPVRRKVVLVGLGDCGIHLRWIRELCFNTDLTLPGKTCLISAFTETEFPKEYIPTVCEYYVASVVVDSRLVELDIRDVNGLNEYERLRAHIYPGSHVILVCYSIDFSDSLDNVIETV